MIERRMNIADFKTYLTSAIYHATKFAERYVVNELFYEFRFMLSLNQSFDGHASEENELYPEDDGRVIRCLDLAAASEVLCRNEKVPEWVDISVSGVGDGFTELELICCGRFTANPGKLRYASKGQGPFGIKGPRLPPGFNPDIDDRFSLPKVDPVSGINSVTLRSTT